MPALNYTLPSPIDCPEIRELVDAWIASRKEARKPVTQHALAIQIRRLEKWGKPSALAALEHSIANGYQGIFPAPFNPAKTAPVQPGQVRPADASALEDYKRQLADLPDHARNDLVSKVRDTLGKEAEKAIANHLWTLRNRERYKT